MYRNIRPRGGQWLAYSSARIDDVGDAPASGPTFRSDSGPECPSPALWLAERWAATCRRTRHARSAGEADGSQVADPQLGQLGLAADRRPCGRRVEYVDSASYTMFRPFLRSALGSARAASRTSTKATRSVATQARQGAHGGARRAFAVAGAVLIVSHPTQSTARAAKAGCFPSL